MTGSRFITIAVFMLALIFGTRWCILTFYSGTYASSDPRGTIQLTSPIKSSGQKSDVSFEAVKVPIQEAQAASGS
jgi:hypothetical protein